jgi:hypothetical protein
MREREEEMRLIKYLRTKIENEPIQDIIHMYMEIS